MTHENQPAGNESTEDHSRSEPAELPAAPVPFRQTDDFWAIVLGSIVLIVGLISVLVNVPDYVTAKEQAVATDSDDAKPARAANPELHSILKPLIKKPGKWTDQPLAAVGLARGEAATLWGLLGVLVISLLLFSPAVIVSGTPLGKFLPAFLCLFLLAVIAYVLAGQQSVRNHSLSYALWALLAGLVISNTIGTPALLKPAVRTELYIKTGLVILGAGILVPKLLALGIPGVFVAWVVTPIVLITTFWFGQKILKMKSASLNMVIAADMCVCGVSAAIATAAACKAKKEELSAAIGLSLMFTVAMMLAMPKVIEVTGMSEVLGGAWMGGTIDATGAVALAGETLGDDALEVASTVKMIQNILIGIIAFCVSVYWVRFQEKGSASEVGVKEIWTRFPKFVLGFIGASIIFSCIYSFAPNGEAIASAVKADVNKTLRGWFFCLAFVAIGLETNFRELAKQFQGGKPLVLYVCGQTLNLILTLAMAWFMFEVMFPEVVAEALKK